MELRITHHPGESMPAARNAGLSDLRLFDGILSEDRRSSHGLISADQPSRIGNGNWMSL
jgi:hypothetical protein